MMSQPEKERLNRNSVGIMAGSPGGKYIEMTADMATLLDDHIDLEMRVVGMIGQGSIQNIKDLLNLRRVDFAIVQNDVLDYLSRQSGYKGIQKRIGYVTRLYDEEIHVLARGPIKSLRDLQGQPVAIGTPGSGTRLTGETMLRIFDISVEPLDISPRQGRAELADGSIAAMIYVGGKPLSLFSEIGTAEAKREGLHFLEIPEHPMLTARYKKSLLTSADYPMLLTEGSSVQTLSVTAVLAVYWWPEGHARYHSTARFVRRLFTQFQALSGPGFDPKWREVDLAAEVPGWRRYLPAVQWLEANKGVPTVLGGAEPDCFSLFRAQMSEQGQDVEALSMQELGNALGRFSVGHPDLCG